MSIDAIIDDKVATSVTAQIATALSGILKGDPGASAYDVAVANGFVGTEAEWLASLIATGSSVVSFPSPHVGAGHFGAGWDGFKEQLDALHVRAQGLPQPSGAKMVADSSNGTTNAYGAPVRMLDGGSFFFPPRSSSSARIYRMATKSLVQPAGAYWGTDGYSSACAGKKGIYLAPYNADHVARFKPDSESVDTPKTGLGSGTYKFADVKRTVGGLLVFCPHNSPYLATYNEDTNTWWQSGNVFTTAYGWGGLIPLPDGRMFGVPHMSTKHFIFDPADNSITFSASIYPGAESFWGGYLDGSVVRLGPHKADRPWSTDYTTGVTTPFAVSTGTSGTANHRGMVRTSDDRGFLVPFQTGAKLVDFATGTVKSAPGSYSGGAHGGGCLMDDGNILLSPFNSSATVIAATGQGFPLDPELLLSPHA